MGDLSKVGVLEEIEGFREIAAVLGWKATELAVGWWGEYDGKFISA